MSISKSTSLPNSLIPLNAWAIGANLAGLQSMPFDKNEFIRRIEQARLLRFIEEMFPSSMGG